MPDTITQQLENVFQKASLSYARKLLTSIEGVEKLSAITQETAEKREELIRRYHEERDARVDAERQRLYHEAAQAKFHHPAPLGVPSINHDTITTQAHQLVRLAHDADLRRVADESQAAIEKLLADAHQRGETRTSATEAFLRVHDRRSGRDRRVRNQSQD